MDKTFKKNSKMASYFSYFPNVYIGEGITEDEKFLSIALLKIFFVESRQEMT